MGKVLLFRPFKIDWNAINEHSVELLWCDAEERYVEFPITGDGMTTTVNGVVYVNLGDGNCVRGRNNDRGRQV